MKSVLMVLGIVSLLAAFPAYGEAAPEAGSGTVAETGWANALLPRGKKAPEITLASGGKAHYAILLPATPDAKEEKAAAELAKWFKEMSAADFVIVKEGSSGEAVTKQGAATQNAARQSIAKLPSRFISVGRTQMLQKARLPQAALSLNPEGLAIGQKDTNLYLFGGTRRGPIYAALALLEEDLGCRWYTPDNTVIPHCPELKVAVVPRVTIRHCQTSGTRITMMLSGTRNGIYAIDSIAHVPRFRPSWVATCAMLRGRWGYCLFTLIINSSRRKNTTIRTPNIMPFAMGHGTPISFVKPTPKCRRSRLPVPSKRCV
jgi:hypothetical protein